MSRILLRNFNRTAITFDTGVGITTSACAIQLKSDSSQQYRIYGISAAYVFNTPADADAVRSGYIAGYLDFRGDFFNTIFDGLFPSEELGEIFITHHLRKSIGGAGAGINDALPFEPISYENPLVINADRSLTFILSPPEGAGFVGNARFYLTVRGEVTQISEQDKPRLGDWTIR